MISFNNILRISATTCRALLNGCRQNVCYPTAGVKTLEEKIGLPPKPKKPLTPFFRFMKQMRPSITAENPKATIVDLVKIISKMWKSLEPASKQKLQDEYKKEQIVYVERRAKYDSRITEEQRSEIKQLKQEIVEAKERKVMKKRIKELGRPKKPASAFLRFITIERKLTPQLPNETYREWHQKITAKWSHLADSEKDVHIQEARKKLEIYKKEMTLWEEKMVRQGHIDVVRHETLIDPPESKPKAKQTE